MRLNDTSLPGFQRVHPVYRQMAPLWNYLRASYIGGEEWAMQGHTYTIGPFSEGLGAIGTGLEVHSSGFLSETNRLWRYEREKDEKYNRRLRASSYDNIVRPCVDVLASAICKARKSLALPPALDYLQEDSDRCGTDLMYLQRTRLVWSFVFSHMHILVDIPQGDPMPSLFHERQAGIRPYAKLISPLDLLDWRYNPDTLSYDWVEIREHMPLYREPHAEDSKAPFRTRVIWPDEYILYQDGEEIERGPTPGPSRDWVPLSTMILCKDPWQAEPVGISPIRDVAKSAEVRFNKKSWLTDQEMAHCFNQVFIKSQAGISAEMDRALGTHTYISAEDMRFVSPDVGPMTHLMDSLREDYQQIKVSLGIETKGEESQAKKAAQALQLERENLDAILSGYATAAETGERQWLRMAAIMAGEDPEAIEVEYTQDFSSLNAASRFEMMLSAINDAGLQGKAKAELQKQIFTAASPDTPQEVLKEIFLDIEESVATLEAMAATLPGMAPGEEGEEQPTDETEEPTDKANGRFGKGPIASMKLTS